MNPRVLVTTPNGRTGRAAVQELVQLGLPVRALVRRDDERAARLRALGVEVVVGSLHDLRDLRRACRDVQRAYHCPPFDSTHLHGSMLFALAALEAGIEVVALMSGWNPHPTHSAHMQREHWIANNLYRQLDGLDVIHINPGLFAFTYLLTLPTAKHLGVLPLPLGEGRNAPPSNEDIGAVAAHALANPAPWIGKCLRPMGPELLTTADVAATVARVLERRVVHRDISTRMFVKFATAMDFPPYAIAHVRRYAVEARHGVYGQPPNGVVREVTGRDPEPFETTVRRYASNLDLVWPGLRYGTRLGQLGLALRAMLTRAPDLDRWEAEIGLPQIERGELAHESAAWRKAASAGRLVLSSRGRPRA